MNVYDNIKNKLNNVKNDIISVVYAPPTESRFFEEGKLTPQEFITSGDALINMCPQWKWMPASAEKYKNKYLPTEKQYLLMEKVPCDQRVQELMDSIAVNEKEDDEEYIINDQKKNNDQHVIETKIGQLSIKEHFTEGKQGGEEKKEENEDDNVVVVEAPIERRYYDLSICYDLVTYTPHLFLQGVDEDNVPLKQNQVFEDIVSHYSNKTITFEVMPQTGIIQASLHPCKHSQVIKHMVDNINQSGGSIKSHQCLFVFLKFLQSVIPTIEYDVAGDIIFDE
ncbi:hypothetical protein ABPG72_010774 [Tetrahymena utriculariae]